jgi:hypothetical protein
MATLDEEFRAASLKHQEALAEYRRIEAELAVARAKLNHAERTAGDLWRKVLDHSIQRGAAASQ